MWVKKLVKQTQLFVKQNASQYFVGWPFSRDTRKTDNLA